MKKLKQPVDSNIFIRLFYLHYFIHIFRIFTGSNASQTFSKPRFDLFRPLMIVIPNKESYSLFKNLLFTFQKEIIIGGIVTIIGASLNLMVPQLIRTFVEFMNSHDLTKKQIKGADQLLYKFILIQTLRLFFAEHSKRLFHQLAIRVESTLARKLVSKSLRIARQCRDRIPESQIIHLENVDLKLIFTLFRNMHLIFEVPFTIIVAIIMLFVESKRYGFIAIYWFVIAFLLQRQLDGKMTHCNKTKLGLIEKRSQINYELMEKMKQAKIIGFQGIIIQKNNDLFIQENHDHSLFYGYATLYDITLLLLPILVVSTITLYDMNEANPITVQQVYSLLALLGTCYMPMKSTRTISICMHDGLHSLKRLSQYFNLPQQTKSQLINNNHEIGEIIIKEGTKAAYPHSNYLFQVKNNFHIEIHKGQRLNVISRKSNGSSSFLEMLLGGLKKIKGSVFINGKISYKPEKPFFMKESVEQNIRFYNQSIQSEKIKEIYKLLGLDHDLKYTEGLNMIMDDVNKFTVNTLEKIALARTLVSDADIYIIDSPYAKIDQSSAFTIEQILRQKQQQGKTVITALKFLEFIKPSDKIIILNDGVIQQYGLFEQLTKNSKSTIGKYFKSRQDQFALSETKSQKVLERFSSKIQKMMKDKTSIRSRNQIKKQSVLKLFMPAPLVKNTQNLVKKLKQQEIKQQNFTKYIKKFFSSISFFQLLYILIIILGAQLLHIFIHLFIGHLSQQQMNDGYQDYKNLLILEIILTICLSGIIYLEGELSTYIAIIIGNKLYEQSLTELTKKRITWFANEYSVKIADRFNHVTFCCFIGEQDYEEIFIAVHGLLGIYKNVIIFVATIEFIHTNRTNIIIIMTFLIVVYFVVFKVIRNVEKKVVKHYYDYKYGYVRVLQESVRGAEIYKIFNIKKEIMKRTENKYEHLASYKLAESYTTFAISILTDVISIVLLGGAISYGLYMKVEQNQHRHIAVIATSVTLLMNLSEVLKIIIKESLNFGTFFSINIMPFLQILDFDTQYKKETLQKNISNQQIHFSNSSLQSFDIKFTNIILKQPSILSAQHPPLNLTIRQGQRVLIYETDDQSRNLLLYAFTRNLPMFTQLRFFEQSNQKITIGTQDIRQIHPKKLRQIIGVIIPRNFYFSGTLRENLIYQGQINIKQAMSYIELLGLHTDLQDFQQHGLQTKLNFQSNQLNPSIPKKLALLRILLTKPKIILLKDTSSFIQSLSIIQTIDFIYPKTQKPTIIKITNIIESSFDMDRVIHMEHLEIKKQGDKMKLLEENDQKSEIGKMLKDINLQGYLYTNRIQTMGKKKISSVYENKINKFKVKKVMTEYS